MIRTAVAWLTLRFAFSANRRCDAIRRLAGAGPSAIPTLFKEVVNSRDDVRDAALNSLRRMRPEAIAWILRRFERTARTVFTPRALSGFLRDIDPEQCGAAAVAHRMEAARLRCKRAPERCTELIHDYLCVLEDFGDAARPGVFALKNLIDDVDVTPTAVAVGFELPSGAPIEHTPLVRHQALRVLAKISGGSEIAYLGRLALGGESGLQCYALDYLAGLKDCRALPFFIRALESDGALVLWSCLQGIEGIGPAASSAQDHLVGFVEGSRTSAAWPKQTAYYAMKALCAIGAAPERDVQAKVIVEALQESQRDNMAAGWNFRLEIASRLSRLGPAFSLPHLEILRNAREMESDKDVARVLALM